MIVKRFLLLSLVPLLLLCCSKEDPVEPTSPEPEPTTPEETAKPRLIWVDASANFPYYANDKAYITKEVKKIADCGATGIIVDVRPTEGTVLFESATAPAATRLAAWVGSQYKFIYRTATWDYLQAFIDAGYAAGLDVYAAINTFVGGYGGYYGLESEGPIFTGQIPQSWATVQNTAEGLKSSFYDGVQGTVFLNPANDDVCTYMLALLEELAGYEGLKGIILDRCRFDDSGLQSDFSDCTRDKFTAYLGHEPENWPVFDAGTQSLPQSLSDEQYSWMSFRAKTIHDFVEQASQRVHAVNDSLDFGCYVGAWYSSYYTSGVNWASPRYNTHAAYPKWADTDYQNYGYADHCDLMILGCYASTSSIYGHGEWTMQGFCENGKKLLMGDTVFAGGPDIGNSTGWTDGGQGGKLYSTIDACTRSADGYFLFDLCHIRMFNYWNDFKEAVEKYINSLK